MAVRSWRIGPDEVRRTPRGDIACVSRQAQLDGIADAMTCCDRLGGVIGVIYGRAPSGEDGEMLTTGLIVNWQDRADAKTQREEQVAFEPSGEVVVLEPEEPEALIAEQV